MHSVASIRNWLDMMFVKTRTNDGVRSKRNEWRDNDKDLNKCKYHVKTTMFLFS